MKNTTQMKPHLMFTLATACLVVAADAQYVGIYGYGIELKGTGAGALNSGATSLYALDNNGTTRLTPIGSSAVLNQTSWANGTQINTVLNLGTFNPNLGDTLRLLGGVMLTYQGGGATVGSAVYLNYAVDPVAGPFTNFGPGIQLGLNETNVMGTAGDLRWSEESKNIDLLAGLTPGTYVLGSYGFANSTLGDQFANNFGGNPQFGNYGASFTVVPEPATAVFVGLGLAALLSRRNRNDRNA